MFKCNYLVKVSLLISLFTPISSFAMHYLHTGVIKWNNDYLYDADVSTEEKNNSYLIFEFAPTLGFTENLTFDLGIVFEQFDQAFAKNPDRHEHIWFESEGLFLEEAYFTYTLDPLKFWWGKFNPHFGIAWKDPLGIWGTDMAEDYETVEKIGLGLSLAMKSEKMGEHELAVNSFFTDTSFLSGSTITNRGKTKLSDAGAGNTENLNNYIVSLDGHNVFTENLGYHLGYRYLAQADKHIDSVGTGDREMGYTVGLHYLQQFNDEIKLRYLGEVAFFDKFGGQRDEDTEEFYDRLYVTLGLVNYYRDWNLSLSHTWRKSEFYNNNGQNNDHLSNVSVGYDFANGFLADAGYRHERAGGNNTNIVGF